MELLANLARRAHLPLIGIRLLNPIIRPNRKVAEKATAQESLEYAACLIRIGSVDEALRILEEVNRKDVPESYLYSAFGHFAKWQYREAIPLLESYLAQKNISDYQRLIGRVNLLAALVHEKNTSAESMGRELLKETKLAKANLLHANTLELLSQYYILKKQFTNADRQLAEAEALLDTMETLDAFFIQKWKVIKKIYENPISKEANKELDAIISNAKTRKHYETVRDCERHRCLATQNVKLAELLYCGTPNERFREELLKEFPKEIKLGETYLRQFGEKEAKRTLDLTDSKKIKVKSGSLLPRALLTLLSDSYRPLRLASLYSILFPNEYYNPVSAPNRVHQLLRRLRQELKKQKIPLNIKEEDGSYFVEAEKPVAVLLPVRKIAENTKEPRIAQLRRTFGEKDFSVHEASRILKLSQRSTSRLLLENTRSGQLAKSGVTLKARYKFT